jgi:hypothetical protein
MKCFFTIAILVGLLSMPVLAHAEGGTCPDGYYPVGGPGVQGCAPIPGGGGESVDPGPEWETRWIAVAVDSGEGVFGAAKDMSSKRNASKAAIAQCRERGGKSCKPFGVTYNQCFALASGGRYINSFGSPTREGAQNGALEECERKAMGCQIYFSDCSYPQRVR